jgi:hypothetical protein
VGFQSLWATRDRTFDLGKIKRLTACPGLPGVFDYSYFITIKTVLSLT